jgi:flagellar biosynthesis protein FlhA
MILTEYVRTSLARTICQHYRDNNRVLRVITLDPVVEDVLKAGFDFGDNQLIVKLSPQVTEAITQAIGVELDKLTTMGLQPIVLCSTPVVRAGLKQTTAASLTKVAFIALNEITIDTQVESVGQITVDCLREAVVAAI